MPHNGREDQNPWTKWYWQDWCADAGLRSSSLAAKGLWMDILSIMARSKKKGFLLDGERPMDIKTLAKFTGETMEIVAGLLMELCEHAVFSTTEDGIIFNRRMVRDSEISDIRAMSGRRGGRPKKTGKQNESKTKAKHKQGVKAKGKAPSASASAYVSILEYLNLKTGKKFSLSSKSSTEHINARIAEGRTIEEFKRVIDNKVSTWLGDPKMDAYLRPETLFSQSKFDAYLNERQIAAPVDKEKRVGSAAGFAFTPEQEKRIPTIKSEYAEKIRNWRKKNGLKDDAEIDLMQVPTETVYIRQRLAEGVTT
jgi:uncharacterized phage protein (TIGR02220 family)